MGHIEGREQYEELKAKEIGHYLEIKEVTKNSPSDHFGLLAGDIIISIDDKDIQVVPQVIELLWERNPGDQVSFKVYRDHEYHTIDIVLGKAKNQKPNKYPK